MITNDSHLVLITNRATILTALKTSGHEFVLFGSFAVNPHLANDIDFFTQETPEVIKFLTGLGFNDVTMATFRDRIGYARDQITSKIFRHSEAAIDVALVSEFDVKVWAWTVLKRDLYTPYQDYDKRTIGGRRRIQAAWNRAYADYFSYPDER